MMMKSNIYEGLPKKEEMMMMTNTKDKGEKEGNKTQVRGMRKNKGRLEEDPQKGQIKMLFEKQREDNETRKEGPRKRSSMKVEIKNTDRINTDKTMMNDKTQEKERIRSTEQRKGKTDVGGQ